MTIPAWPSINYKALSGTWQLTGDAIAPLASEMNSGTTRRRNKYTLRVSEMTFKLVMTAAEVATFRTFVTTTLGNGAARFTMPVWDGTAYVNRTVSFAKGSMPTYDTFSYQMSGVGLKLEVESL